MSSRSPSRPVVSAVMCVLNGERFLDEAIGSIVAQSYPNFEIVFIDDGSTDGTAEIASGRADRVQYTYQENRGVPAARNRGVDLALCLIFRLLGSHPADQLARYEPSWGLYACRH